MAQPLSAKNAIIAFIRNAREGSKIFFWKSVKMKAVNCHI
jgi:hypothetical protein